MTSNNNDIFGIKEIYPTDTNTDGALPWYLGIGNWSLRAPRWKGTESHSNGFLQLNIAKDDGQIRYDVQAVPNEFSVNEIDQSKLRSRGYMGTKKDWKNVEMTLYAKINQTEGNKYGGPHFELLARGGARHTDSKPCEGIALHTNLYVKGRVKLEKELSHTKGYTDNDPQKQNVTSDLMENKRWIGMKGIFYNTKNGNVKLELWLDKDSTNDWGEEPVIEYEDKGGWEIGNNHKNECGGEKDERITWGGPVVIFRWDNITNVDIKYASVREIVPPK